MLFYSFLPFLTCSSDNKQLIFFNIFELVTLILVVKVLVFPMYQIILGSTINMLPRNHSQL